MTEATWTGQPAPDDDDPLDPRRTVTIDDHLGPELSDLVASLDDADPLTLDDVARELRLLGVHEPEALDELIARIEATALQPVAAVIGEPLHHAMRLARARHVLDLLAELAADFTPVYRIAATDAALEAERQHAAGRHDDAALAEQAGLAWADKLAEYFAQHGDDEGAGS